MYRNTTDTLRFSVGSYTYILRVRLHILHIAALDFAAYDVNVCSIEMILNMAIILVEELKTNLMSLVIFISLIICSTCFEH